MSGAPKTVGEFSGCSVSSRLGLAPAPCEGTSRRARSSSIDPTDTTGHADCARLTAEQVADLLETVHAANGRIACEVDLIFGSRAAVGQHTVDRFTRLAIELRPGAAARAELAALNSDLLMAGTSLWMPRRRTSAASANARAAQRWGGRQTA